MKFMILLSFLASTLFALTQKQIETLQAVRDVARTIPDKRGETFENTLSAICLTESSGGRDMIGDFKKGTSVTKASLGAMQIQARTARFMARTYPELAWINELSDFKIVNKLISDIEFSATIAAYYMKWLSDYRKSYYSAVSGYNGGTSNWPYYMRVKKNLTYVQSLVKEGVLH
jgi:soluble lytic murein transglycosylase-like protein